MCLFYANVHLLLLQLSNTMKTTVTFFDQALGALLCLVCCDQGLTAYV